jgi:hypothetical protein
VDGFLGVVAMVCVSYVCGRWGADASRINGWLRLGPTHNARE